MKIDKVISDFFRHIKKCQSWGRVDYLLYFTFAGVPDDDFEVLSVGSMMTTFMIFSSADGNSTGNVQADQTFQMRL